MKKFYSFFFHTIYFFYKKSSPVRLRIIEHLTSNDIQFTVYINNIKKYKYKKYKKI